MNQGNNLPVEAVVGTQEDCVRDVLSSAVYTSGPCCRAHPYICSSSGGGGSSSSSSMKGDHEEPQLSTLS